MIKKCVFLFSLLSCFVAGFGHGVIKGVVRDSLTKEPIQNVCVQISGAAGSCMTNMTGCFSFSKLAKGEYTVILNAAGFSSKTLHLYLDDPDEKELNVFLSSRVMQIQEILVSGTKDPQEVFTQFGALGFNHRPKASAQDLLRLVPGLVIAQHAGGGKAEQIFLRGFDADHGTDVRITVDGMPVNMVSHAHGQGYADLHFVIPEVVNKMDFTKGPYYADQGNFATAGNVGFTTKKVLPSNLVKTELGSFDTYRGLAMINLIDKKDDRSAYVAAEFLSSNGPFEKGQHLDRLSLFTKYSQNFDNKFLSFSISSFTSGWDASGQIPERAVRSGQITRFGSIDNFEGGETSRSNINLELMTILSESETFRNQIYFSNYSFSLFSNFTFFLKDSINGDRIHQHESRKIIGYNGIYTKEGFIKNKRIATSLGYGLRMDDVRELGLSKMKDREQLLSRNTFGNVKEKNAFVYAQGQISITPLLKAQIGIRADVIQFKYYNALTPDNGSKQVSKMNLGPNFNLDYFLSDKMQIYFKSGSGFHSNDSRVVTTRQGHQVLPKAYGADLGAFLKPHKKILVNAAVWGLFLQQEFVYVGDEGIVELSGRSLRKGLDFSFRYSVTKNIEMDIDLNYVRPTAMDEEKGSNYIPLAPFFTSTGGLVYTNSRAAVAIRYRKINDRPADQSYLYTAWGYTLVDLTSSYSINQRFTINGSIENIFNTEWNEAQFLTESRLAHETTPVSELHFTPGSPISFKVGASFSF